MHRINHIMQLDGDEDDFAIASYDLGIRNIRKGCPAIKMEVLDCRYKEEDRDFLETVSPVNRLEDLHRDFRKHYEEIVQGRCESWRLISIIVRPAKLELEFYSETYDREERVLLNVDGRRIRQLDLKFEVPHTDDRPSTEYMIMLERNEAMSGSGSTIIQANYPHLHQHQVFMVTSLSPSELSVTDIFDL